MKKNKAPKILKSYPEMLSIFVAIFISGLIISEKFSPELYVLWLGISLASMGLSAFTKEPSVKPVSLIVAALTASMFYGSIRSLPKSDFSDLLALDNSTGNITGKFTGKTAIQGNNIWYTFNEVTYTAEEQNIAIPLEIKCKSVINRQRLYPEQYYSMSGKMRITSFDRPPIFEIASFTIKEAEFPSAITIAKQIQEKIKQNLTYVLKKEHSAIVTGFILGDTSKISNKNIFIETGISHLLAISGQHIMILIFLIASILHWFKIPPISRSVLISIILIFYAMITAGSPSVWRALIMYFSVATIFHIEAYPSPVKSVSLAALLMLLYDPSLIHNTAFILSFTAVLSIIYLRQPFEYLMSKLHLPDMVGKYLAVTFATNLGIMPMSAYIFGTLSLSSLLVNPLLLWTFAFILPTAFAIAILAMISTPLAVFLSPGLSVLLDVLIGFLTYVKEIPGLYFYVGNLNSSALLSIYVLLLTISMYFNKWQIKNTKIKLQKPEISKIPVKTLPKNEMPEIHIDSSSKATPTLIENPRTATLIKTHKNTAMAPFKNQEIVEAMDNMLCGLSRIHLNNSEKSEEIFFVNKLSVEGQNLYYRLFAMNEDTFEKEPERLLQAHIFMLAIAGYELLKRISQNLNPPLSIDQLNTTDIRAKDRSLAVAILSENIINSFSIGRVIDEKLGLILEDGRKLHMKAARLLDDILNDKSFKDSVKSHMLLREDFVNWCQHFVQRDNILKLQKKKNLR